MPVGQPRRGDRPRDLRECPRSAAPCQCHRRRAPDDAASGQRGRMTDDTALPCIVAFTPRERTRAMIRSAFPRRRSRVLLTRTSADFAQAFRAELVDAAIVDVGSGNEDAWTAAA